MKLLKIDFAGPEWLPIFGSALKVAKMRKDMGGYLYQATAELARQFGPVVGLKVRTTLLLITINTTVMKYWDWGRTGTASL